jgi:hypothetical protein
VSTYVSHRVRGLAPWRPHAETRTLLEQVEVVLSDHAEHLLLTLRQVFYRLVARFDFPKTENGYERLCNALNRARRAGVVAFDAIRDDGLTVAQPIGYDDLAQFWRLVRQDAEDYRRDRLGGQPVVPEVWVEAAGMVPQVTRVVQDFGVAVYSSSGFDSLTAKYQAARRVMDRSVPTLVLHVGDHDPSGLSVFDSAAEDVVAMVCDLLACRDTDAVEFRRVAVTPEQIATYDLSTAPPKATDRRGDWTGDTVQAEALDPATLADIVRQAVESALDSDVLAGTLETEEHERDALVATVAELGI